MVSETTGRPASSAGFTLIEIMVVMAIMALMAAGSVRGFRSLARSDLRSAAGHLSGAVRYLFDRASTTGKQHRLVIDLSEGRYWAEVSDDRFFLPREKEDDDTRRKQAEDDEEADEAEKKRAEETERLGYDPAELAAQEFRPKRARFAAFKEVALKPVTLKRARISSVFTSRLAEPVTGGQAYVYFFPLGQTEPAWIDVSDEDGENTYTLVVHPLTGRVRIHDQRVDPPIEAAVDDEGNRAEP